MNTCKNWWFEEQSVVILWVIWCKNKSFWQSFTYKYPWNLVKTSLKSKRRQNKKCEILSKHFNLSISNICNHSFHKHFFSPIRTFLTMMYTTWMKLTKTKIVEKRKRLGYLIQLGALYSAQTSILLTREASTSSGGHSYIT